MLTVRLLHVLAMALVLGGAAVTWWLFRLSIVGGETEVSVDTAIGIATAYERGFWAAMGVLVMTGVGNLGSLAPSVPEASSLWGTAFAVKLTVVIAFLVLSLVRTIVVQRYCRVGADAERGGRTLRLAYSSTALAVTGLVALAEVLAHG